MKKHWFFLLLSVSACLGQSGDKSSPIKSAIANYAKVSLCQVSSDPGSFNRKRIEVDAFVTHGFEDSSVFESGCGGRFGIWMEYGGTASTATMYCCGFTPKDSRPDVLTVEGLKLPLVENDNFALLNSLLKKDRGRTARATLKGTFFSGKQDPYRNGKTNIWGGYGHMGCCSLFVIQEVVSVRPHDIEGLDYESTIDQPNSDKEGCGTYSWHDGDDWKSLVEKQRTADSGAESWRYSQPDRVGVEALAKFLSKPPNAIKLVPEKNTEGRIVYYWRPTGRKGVRYMVVVNRPYELSLQAKEPAKTIWASSQIYTVCG